MIIDKLKYADRFMKYEMSRAKRGEKHEKYLNHLKEKGYCVIENLIPSEQLLFFQKDIDDRLKNHQYEMPCLDQNKIDSSIPEHKQLIENHFLASQNDLEKLKLTFSSSDVKGVGYGEMLERCSPSTLKLYIPQEREEYAQLWFKEELLHIIESYLGLRPYCVEAYIRRNFPCRYPVMNHHWHRDRNNPNYLLKMFILFTDCTMKTGPHQFVEGSHIDQTLSGKNYYQPEEVDAFSSQNNAKIVSSVFKAGTIIIEDTRGLHRALIPEEGYRDLGFAVFVPMTFLGVRKESYFHLSRSVYKKLSPYQQSYIGKVNLC